MTLPVHCPCRDMCDNMERFFHQAWKDQRLQLACWADFMSASADNKFGTHKLAHCQNGHTILHNACRDMCDNMERFFYQAWKEQGLQLPPGAGPTLSRRPSKSKAPNSSWEEPQADRGHKRQHAASYFEVRCCSLKAFCELATYICISGSMLPHTSIPGTLLLTQRPLEETLLLQPMLVTGSKLLKKATQANRGHKHQHGASPFEVHH